MHCAFFCTFHNFWAKSTCVDLQYYTRNVDSIEAKTKNSKLKQFISAKSIHLTIIKNSTEMVTVLQQWDSNKLGQSKKLLE